MLYISLRMIGLNSPSRSPLSPKINDDTLLTSFSHPNRKAPRVYCSLLFDLQQSLFLSIQDSSPFILRLSNPCFMGSTHPFNAWSTEWPSNWARCSWCSSRSRARKAASSGWLWIAKNGWKLMGVRSGDVKRLRKETNQPTNQQTNKQTKWEGIVV